MTSINWYPGHMKKTKDMILENLKIIDIVLEIVDARVPLSSKNPDIEKITKNKHRILLLNKSDLVTKSEIDYWREYFIKNNLADEVLDISAETGQNIKKLYEIMNKFLNMKKEKMLKRGILNTTAKILIAGIPNVGKSKLINILVGKKATGVGDRPGFTKGKQWVRIKSNYELLDTPGILWPKFESEQVGINLAIVGSIKDDILDIEYITNEFINYLRKSNKLSVIRERYKIEESIDEFSNSEIIDRVSIKMGNIQKGGILRTEQTAYAILKDYRDSRLGKFGVEK